MYLPVQMGHAIHPQLATSGTIPVKYFRAQRQFLRADGPVLGGQNLDSDYIGIVHYRRYFASRLHRFERKSVGSSATRNSTLFWPPPMLCCLKSATILLKPNYTQYIHAHHEQDLRVTRAIIERKCPEYLPAYDTYMSKRTAITSICS